MVVLIACASQDNHLDDLQRGDDEGDSDYIAISSPGSQIFSKQKEAVIWTQSCFVVAICEDGSKNFAFSKQNMIFLKFGL